MFEQELHKLKREELLEIMLAQSREIDSLTEELEKERARNTSEEGVEEEPHCGASVEENEKFWTRAKEVLAEIESSIDSAMIVK